MINLIYLIVGAVGGVLGGMLGIGGGIVFVPAIYFVLLNGGYPPEHLMQASVCTSLAVTLVNSLSASIAQRRKKAIPLKLVLYALPGLALGCVNGSFLAHFLPSEQLRVIFGLLVFPIGIYYFFPKLPQPSLVSRPKLLLSFFGILIGNLSSILGIGGGIFSVPLYLSYGSSTQGAVAASSLSTIATSLIGTSSYLALSWNLPHLPHSLGYIELTSFVPLAIASIAAAPFGVKLAHRLPSHTIRRIFAFALIATSAAMIFR